MIIEEREGKNWRCVMTEKDFLTIEQATAILGERFVIDQDFVNFKRYIQISIVHQVHYPEELLQKCSAENKTSKTYWMLIWLSGESLLYQFENQSKIDLGGKVFFHKTPFGKPDNYALFREKHPAGYYLINMQPYFSEISWEEMMHELSKQEASKTQLQLCPINLFCEAIINVYMEQFIRIPENWYHATREIVEIVNDGNIAVIGKFNRNGIDVNAVRKTGKGPILNGVVYHKPFT